jgi:HEAT repeat protein
MLNHNEFTGVVKHLTGEKLSLRVAALKDFQRYPSGDRRILPYLERFLYDKTPCLIAIPFVYGEIRWLAAHALAAERAALGINEPVRLRNVVKPLDQADYAKALKAANIMGRGGLEGVLSTIATLRDGGYLPMIKLNLLPKPSQRPKTASASKHYQYGQPEWLPA